MEVYNKSLSVKFVKADYLCRRHTFKSYIILKKSPVTRNSLLWVSILMGLIITSRSLSTFVRQFVNLLISCNFRIEELFTSWFPVKRIHLKIFTTLDVGPGDGEYWVHFQEISPEERYITDKSTICWSE